MRVLFNEEVYELDIAGIRKSLHEEVDNIVYELDPELVDEFMDDLEEIHELISAQDLEGLLDGFFFNGEVDFGRVDEDDVLVDALKLAGYEVESSNVSRSIYVINDNGEEVRISDHKRPAILQGNVAIHEHEYDHEIIVDNKVYSRQLKAAGINLDKESYILG